MPILSTLKGWKYGFNSPFKAEVYFVTTRMFTDLKWGTQNPIMMRDPEFGMVRLRAFGTYAIQVVDPGTFLTQARRHRPAVPHRRDRRTAAPDMIVARFVDALGRAEDPGARPRGATSDELGNRWRGVLTDEFADCGLEIPQFFIENISLPPEVEAGARQAHARWACSATSTSTRKFQTAERDRATPRRIPAASPARASGSASGMAVGQQMAAGARTAERGHRRGSGARRVRTATVAIASTVVHRRQR